MKSHKERIIDQEIRDETQAASLGCECVQFNCEHRQARTKISYANHPTLKTVFKKCTWCKREYSGPLGCPTACAECREKSLVNNYTFNRSYPEDFAEPFTARDLHLIRECTYCQNNFFSLAHRLCKTCFERSKDPEQHDAIVLGKDPREGVDMQTDNNEEITKSRKEQLLSFLTVKMCSDPDTEKNSVAEKNYLDVMDILRKSVELHQHEIVNGSVYDHAKQLSDSVAVLEAQFLRKATAMESMKKMLQSPEKYSIYELMQEAFGGGYLMNINFQETTK